MSFLTFQVRVSELELEVEELRQLWKSSSRSSRPDLIHMMPHPIFLRLEEDGQGSRAKTPAALKRWDSERLLRATLTPPDSPGRIYDHECSCARRAEVTKYRGISLLNEVDAQYSALQAKYEQLLQRCQLGQEEEEDHKQEEEQQEEGSSHKSIRTTGAPAPADEQEDHQPEYKKIFQQIFSHIHKSKRDLGQRGGVSKPR